MHKLPYVIISLIILLVGGYMVSQKNNQLPENVLSFRVAPEKKECVGVGPMECLVVNGEYFYDTIQGFDFEEGYEYDLLVERTERASVPADANKYVYTLVEQVSKTPALGNTLTQSAWQWKETLYSNDDVVLPTAPEKFVLTFQDDARFGATTDCNNVFGSYEATDYELSFGQIAATRKACIGDSQESVFTGMLEETQGYMFNEGNLVLLLKFDSGSVVFEPVE